MLDMTPQSADALDPPRDAPAVRPAVDRRQRIARIAAYTVLVALGLAIGMTLGGIAALFLGLVPVC